MRSLMNLDAGSLAASSELLGLVIIVVIVILLSRNNFRLGRPR